MQRLKCIRRSFGGGLYSPRDPILESKLGGVYIGNDLYTVGGVGGDGHW